MRGGLPTAQLNALDAQTAMDASADHVTITVVAVGIATVEIARVIGIPIVAIVVTIAIRSVEVVGDTAAPAVLTKKNR